jgi:paraquat-inducible protein B
MSTRANPMLIGAFAVGAAALLLVSLLVWGGTGLFRTKLNYVLFFDSEVNGLNKGAPVVVRGVKVGEVTDVQFRWGSPYVAVYAFLEPQSLKGTVEGGPARAIEEAIQRRGLRAQLRMQSFVTGVLYVAMDYHPGTPIVLRNLDPQVPELPTVPSDVEVWTAKLQKLTDMLEKLPLDQIGQNAVAVLEDVKQILESKDTRALLPNANSAIGDVRTLVHRVDGRVDPLFAELKDTLAHVDTTLDAARKLVLDVDGRVDPLATPAEAVLKSAQATLEDMRRLLAKVDAHADPLLISLRHTSDSFGTTMDRAQLTLGSVDQTLDQESPLGYELFQTLKEVRAAAQSVRSLADYFERVPDAVIRGVSRPHGDAK